MKKISTSQRPTAADELKLFRRSIRLLPALARRGAAPADALAIAYNATFLYYNMPHGPFVFSPQSILSRYSLSEIAGLCEEIINGENGGIEYGLNEKWKEVIP